MATDTKKGVTQVYEVYIEPRRRRSQDAITARMDGQMATRVRPPTSVPAARTKRATSDMRKFGL